MGQEDPLEQGMATLSSILAWTIPWTEEPGALQSMGFSRRAYSSGLPLPSPGDLPNSGIEPRSPALQADSLPSEPPGKPLDMVQTDTNVGSPSSFCRTTVGHF